MSAPTSFPVPDLAQSEPPHGFSLQPCCLPPEFRQSPEPIPLRLCRVFPPLSVPRPFPVQLAQPSAFPTRRLCREGPCPSEPLGRPPLPAAPQCPCPVLCRPHTVLSLTSFSSGSFQWSLAALGSLCSVCSAALLLLGLSPPSEQTAGSGPPSPPLLHLPVLLLCPSQCQVKQLTLLLPRSTPWLLSGLSPCHTPESVPQQCQLSGWLIRLLSVCRPCHSDMRPLSPCSTQSP